MTYDSSATGADRRRRLPRPLTIVVAVALGAAALAPTAAAQEQLPQTQARAETIGENAAPVAGLDDFVGEWWNGQEWAVFASGDPGLAVDPPDPIPTPTGGRDGSEAAGTDLECAPVEATDAVHRTVTSRTAFGRAQPATEKAPAMPTTLCPPPPPPTPCSAHFPVGTTMTPQLVTGDVMALEPANGSFVPDELAELPPIGTPGAAQNGAYAGFARLARAVTGQGEAGFVNVEFHLELPDDLADLSDLDVTVTSIGDDGSVASYSPWLSQVFCYADQSGFNVDSVYVNALGIYLLEGQPAPQSVTFVASLNDGSGSFLAADHTTIYVGPPPVPTGTPITDGIGLTLTQDGLNGAEVPLAEHFEPQIEAFIIDELEAAGVEVITHEFGLDLDLSFTAPPTQGSSGQLRVSVDSGLHFYVERNNCYGHLDVDGLEIDADLDVGQSGGALAVSVDTIDTSADNIDVELTSGLCSFFVWEGFIENAIEAVIEAAIVVAPSFADLVSQPVEDFIGGLSLGGLLGGLVNLASTVTLTSVIIQNGGLEIQADASFSADGPFDGPSLPASPAPGPAPNLNFLTSLRTVPSTGDLFGVGTWLSPALLNQLATAAVSEGVFSRTDTVGSSDLATLAMAGVCGGQPGDPGHNQTVFIDFAATAAPVIEDNPSAGGDPATEITTAHLLSINGLLVTFRVADTSCGDNGVIGRLMINVHELGFELTGNSQYQTLGFVAQVHPACPSFGPECPISTVTLSNPLGHPTMGLFAPLTGSSVIATGLPDLLAGLGTTVTMPGAQVGIDVIPMAFDEFPGVVDAYFTILPEPKQPNVFGWETSGNIGPFTPGTTEDFTYSFTASSNMPGPKTFTWTFVQGGGNVTTTGTTSHFFDDFPVPATLPSANGPGVTVKVEDEWGRSIYGWWTDEDIFGENEV